MILIYHNFGRTTRVLAKGRRRHLPEVGRLPNAEAPARQPGRGFDSGGSRLAYDALTRELREQGRDPGLEVLARFRQLPCDGLGDDLGRVVAVAVSPDQGRHQREPLGLGAGAVGQHEMPIDRSEGEVGPGTRVPGFPG